MQFRSAVGNGQRMKQRERGRKRFFMDMCKGLSLHRIYVNGKKNIGTVILTCSYSLFRFLYTYILALITDSLILPVDANQLRFNRKNFNMKCCLLFSIYVYTFESTSLSLILFNLAKQNQYYKSK